MMLVKEGEKEEKPSLSSFSFFFNLKYWCSSRLFSGNCGISTINQIMATSWKAGKQILQVIAGKRAGQGHCFSFLMGWGHHLYF